MDTLELKSPGLGHNNPPEQTLAELLAEETREMKARTDELVEVAEKLTVTDGDSAGRATALARMILDHAKLIEERREAKKKPHLDAGRVIDTHFGALRSPLIGTDPKREGGAALKMRSAVDEHRRKVEVAAAAERKRLEDLARHEREKAEKAQAAQRQAEAAARLATEQAQERARKAEEEARRSGDQAAREKAAREKAEAEATRLREENAAKKRQLEAEIAKNAANEKAEQLERAAANTVAAPIDSGLGAKAHARANWQFEILDHKAALKHALAVDQATIHKAIEDVIARQVRARVRLFPGVKIWDAGATTFR